MDKLIKDSRRDYQFSRCFEVEIIILAKLSLQIFNAAVRSVLQIPKRKKKSFFAWEQTKGRSIFKDISLLLPTILSQQRNNV